VVHANQMAEQFPVVRLDSTGLEAARLLAEHRLPGIVVTDESGQPQSILPASQVVQFLVPTYVQDDPSLARVLSESMADKLAHSLRDKTVRSLLPAEPAPLPQVDADDTIVEVAAVMARLHCPLVAVLADGRLLGVISASRLLQLSLAL
jgi:CBS domain-containing protein